LGFFLADKQDGATTVAVPEAKMRFTTATLILAAFVAILFLPFPLNADNRILVFKTFEGGKRMTASPNQRIAAWGMTVDKVKTERSLVFLGRTGETTIAMELHETERPAKGGPEKEISVQKIPVYLECDGETICKIEEISMALRVSGNTLYYTILADWDEVYIDQKDKVKQCEYGHKWVEKEYLYCPTCGSPLKSTTVKPTSATAAKSDHD
jgi:hypothetical protein